MKNILIIISIMLISLINACSEDSPTADEQNHSPVISSLVANPDTIKIGATAALTCNATDSDGDNLTFVWNAQSGTINGSGSNANWVAPNAVGTYYVSCKVADGNGGEDDDSVNIVVEQQLPTQGLIAYYPFNGNANDESGNGNNGTVHGALLTTDRFSASNSAYIFSGTTEYINTNFTPNNIFSISIWYNKSQNQKDNAGLFSTYSGGFNYSGVYYAMNESTDWIRCDGNSLDAFHTPALSWKHIVIVSNGTRVKVYENTSVKLDFTGATHHSNHLVIGDSRYNGRYFAGKIDDIRIYNRALTDNEITILYHEGGW